MVEYSAAAPIQSFVPPADGLDAVFASLADATRRDILRRVADSELSVGQLARQYQSVTFAAISKHIKVLEQARLVTKRKQGKEVMITLAPGAFGSVEEYFEWYRRRSEERFDALESYLRQQP